MQVRSSEKPYKFFYFGSQHGYSYMLQIIYSSPTNLRSNINKISNVTL